MGGCVLSGRNNYQVILTRVNLFSGSLNGFELSGRGIPDHYLFCPLTSYNLGIKIAQHPRSVQANCLPKS